MIWDVRVERGNCRCGEPQELREFEVEADTQREALGVARALIPSEWQ